MTGRRICLIGLKCYDQLMHEPIPRFLGGAERQLVALAEALAARGHEVSVLTYDEGYEEVVSPKGIQVIPCYSLNDGFAVIRFLHPRITRVVRAIRKLQPDVVIQMGANSETGTAALACAFSGSLKAKLLFCVVSDSDCMRSTPLLPHLRERLMYRYGLGAADRIIVQTATQQAILGSEWRRESVVAPMPAGSLADLESDDDVDTRKMCRVIWVGRVSAIKRLELLLDVASKMPDIQFDIVGEANTTSGYAKTVVARAKQLPNAVVHGKVGDDTLIRLVAGASLLCCTSEMEGFPTSFLEAWSKGKPVVTTFDPDNIVATHELGFVCTNTNDLTSRIRQLADDNDLAEKMGGRCQQFFRAKYTSEAAAAIFENVLDEMLE